MPGTQKKWEVNTTLVTQENDATCSGAIMSYCPSEKRLHCIMGKGMISTELPLRPPQPLSPTRTSPPKPQTSCVHSEKCPKQCVMNDTLSLVSS